VTFVSFAYVFLRKESSCKKSSPESLSMNLSSFHLVILSPDTLVALPVPSLWHPVLVLAVAGICSCRVLQNTLEESVGELFAPV